MDQQGFSSNFPTPHTQWDVHQVVRSMRRQRAGGRQQRRRGWCTGREQLCSEGRQRSARMAGGQEAPIRRRLLSVPISTRPSAAAQISALLKHQSALVCGSADWHPCNSVLITCRSQSALFGSGSNPQMLVRPNGRPIWRHVWRHVRNASVHSATRRRRRQTPSHLLCLQHALCSH